MSFIEKNYWKLNFEKNERIVLCTHQYHNRSHNYQYQVEEKLIYIETRIIDAEKACI